MRDIKGVLKKRMEKYKVLGICGEAGSGKDTFAAALAEELKNKKYKVHQVVSYTTRPKRDYEVDGKDYHFINHEDFIKLIVNGKMLEVSEFNNWFYGTCIDDLKQKAINIEVLNPDGIESLSTDNRIDLCIIRLLCNDKERLIRQLLREENPNVEEIVRRYKTDKEDFTNFHISDYSPWNLVVLNDGTLTIKDRVSFSMMYVRQWAEKIN